MINFQFAQNILASITGGQTPNVQASTDIVQSLAPSFANNEKNNSDANGQDFAQSLKKAEPKIPQAPREAAPKEKLKQKDDAVAHEQAPVERRTPLDTKNKVDNANEATPAENVTETRAPDATNEEINAPAKADANVNPPHALQDDIEDTLKAAQNALQTIDALLALLGIQSGNPLVPQLQQSKEALQSLITGLNQVDAGALQARDPQALLALQQLLGEFNATGEALDNTNKQLVQQGVFSQLPALTADASAEDASAPHENIFAKLSQHLAALEKNLASEQHQVAAALNGKNTAEALLKPDAQAKEVVAEASKPVVTDVAIETLPTDEKVIPFEPRSAKDAPANPVVEQSKSAQGVQTQQAAAVQQLSNVIQVADKSAGAQTQDRVQPTTSNAPFAAPAAPAALQQKTNANFEHGLRHVPKGSATEQVAFTMKTMMKDGIGKMIVKLDPPELGALEIKLQTGRDGRLGINIQVDRPETLEMLQKDSRYLQQALQDMGLKADGSSLSFNLRGDNPGGQQRQGNNPYPVAAADEVDEELLTVVSERYVTEVQHGVNIRI